MPILIKGETSLGRKPRPIMQLFWRTAMFNNYQESGFVWLFRRLIELNYDFGQMWILLEFEFNESRDAALWEESGREFRFCPSPLQYRNIKHNIPFYVFFNGNQVRFVPYLAKAVQSTLGLLPDIFSVLLEGKGFKYLKISINS